MALSFLLLFLVVAGDNMELDKQVNLFRFVVWIPVFTIARLAMDIVAISRERASGLSLYIGGLSSIGLLASNYWAPELWFNILSYAFLTLIVGTVICDLIALGDKRTIK